MKIKNIFYRMNILVFVAILSFFASCEWVTIELPPAEVVIVPENDTVSFSGKIQPILNRCTGCHQTETAGNNNLVLISGQSWASLQKNDRVIPSDPEASILLVYAANPLHDGGNFKSNETPWILKWIEQGALDN